MNTLRRIFIACAVGWLALGALSAAAQNGPDDLIRQMSNQVIDSVKSDKAIQAGDIGRIVALVDSKVMPHVDFKRMTASAVGRHWRAATPAQQQRLEEEFKILLVHSYAGALTQVKNQTVQLKPMRGAVTDSDVVVRTEIKGGGEPVQLDYRLEKGAGGWKIYDVNVLGVWLVDQYRLSFNREINADGVDGLIDKLAARNKGAGKS